MLLIPGFYTISKTFFFLRSKRETTWKGTRGLVHGMDWKEELRTQMHKAWGPRDSHSIEVTVDQNRQQWIGISLEHLVQETLGIG